VGFGGEARRDKTGREKTRQHAGLNRVEHR